MCNAVWQELLRYCEDDDGYGNVKKALATMTLVVKYVNDVMHQNSIKGFNVRITSEFRSIKHQKSAVVSVTIVLVLP